MKYSEFKSALDERIDDDDEIFFEVEYGELWVSSKPTERSFDSIHMYNKHTRLYKKFFMEHEEDDEEDDKEMSNRKRYEKYEIEQCFVVQYLDKDGRWYDFDSECMSHNYPPELYRAPARMLNKGIKKQRIVRRIEVVVDEYDNELEYEKEKEECNE